MNRTIETFTAAKEHRSHADVRHVAIHRKSARARIQLRNTMTVLP